MNPYLDESVGTMLPQVDINGVPLTKEYFVKEWDESGDVEDPSEHGSVDYISSDTQFLLSSINKMKYKLYAVRLFPFTEENYIKEFDIVRNLVSLQKKLRSVIAQSSDNTKSAIEYVINVGTKERNKDIARLMNTIDVQDIKATGVATNTMIKANLLHKNDAKFIEIDTKNIIKPFNQDYELELLSTEELERDYPVGKKIADEYVEIFNHVVNVASNLRESNGYITSFEKEDDDSLLILGCSLLEMIPVDGVKNFLSVYKDTVIGNYNRILDTVNQNKANKPEIRVECCRCPKTGNFYIYLIMKANIITNEEHHGKEFSEGVFADVVDDAKRFLTDKREVKTNDLENPIRYTVHNGGFGYIVDKQVQEKNNLIVNIRWCIMKLQVVNDRLSEASELFNKTGNIKYKKDIVRYEKDIANLEKKIADNKERLQKVYKYIFTESDMTSDIEGGEYTREFVNPFKVKRDDLESEITGITSNGGVVIDLNTSDKNYLIFNTRKINIKIEQLKAKIDNLKSQDKKTNSDRYKNKIEKLEKSIKELEAKAEKNIQKLKDKHDYTFTESSMDDSELDLMDLSAFTEAMEDNMSLDYCYNLLLENMTEYM